MKATMLAQRLKEISGARTYDDALEWVERLLEESKKPSPEPYGMAFVITAANAYHIYPLGRLGLDQLRWLKASLLHYVSNHLEQQIEAGTRAEIEARLRAELKDGVSVSS